MANIAELFKKPRKPLKVVDCDGLPNDKWLEYRKTGIGGSDSASILGISKWRTARELYYDKIGESTPEEIDKGKQYIFDFGHAMEAFVAEHFEKVFEDEYRQNFNLQFTSHYGEPIKFKSARVYRDTWMYRNPENLFMIADLDFKIDFTLEDGRVVTGVFECKTSSAYQIQNAWEAAAPAYYQCQTRHYMATTDLPFTVIACAADNNSMNYYVHIIWRDAEKEKALIEAERDFWQSVQNKIPPEDLSANNIKVILGHLPTIEKQKVEVDDSEYCVNLIKQYEALDKQAKEFSKIIDDYNAQKDIIKSNILTYMTNNNKYSVTIPGEDKQFSFVVATKSSNAMDYTKFFKMCEDLPNSAVIDDLRMQCRKDPAPKATLSVTSKKKKVDKPSEKTDNIKKSA